MGEKEKGMRRKKEERERRERGERKRREKEGENSCHIMKKDASSKCEYSQINQNLYINEGAREMDLFKQKRDFW